MNKIAIVSDTSQDLDFKIAEKYNIDLIPYYIQMGEDHLKDLVDIEKKTFYETMDSYETLSTGTPPVSDVIEKLEELEQKGYQEAILITSSEKLTGMKNVYDTVKSYDLKISLRIYNSSQIAASAGLLAIYASMLRDMGKTSDEIMKELKEKEPSTSIYALFRTLKYVVKGGRFNKYKGLIGAFLHINPICHLDNGEIQIVDKVRGKKKSLDALIRLTKEEIESSKDYMLVVFSGNNKDEMDSLKVALEDEIRKARVFLETDLTPVLGVHAGPGSIGTSVLKLD